MRAEIGNKETAMAIPDALPSQYESFITTSDALEDVESLFPPELVKSRLLPDKQRKEIGGGNQLEPVLLRNASSCTRTYSNPSTIRTHCRRRVHRESNC